MLNNVALQVSAMTCKYCGDEDNHDGEPSLIEACRKRMRKADYEGSLSHEPNAETPDEHEQEGEESDGQPDEAKEWYDFDPDA